MCAQAPLIVFDAVSKVYREAGSSLAVLRDVSFSVQAGEIVALIGRSGSGKSSLLNLIAGIDAPSSGSVRVGGKAIEALDDRARTLYRRRNVGFVYQFFNLIPTLNLLENVRLPLELNGRAQADNLALAMLDRVGLADRSAAFPDRLSGGEQQRVAIARALVCEPPIVLADEPTGNLDRETGQIVLDLLYEMTRDAGRTLIIVTHSQAVAAAADRRLRIRSQRVMEDVS